MEFGFDFGVLRQEVPGPGEGVGYGLVTGEEYGENFVADLTVGHVFGLFSGGGLGFGGFVGAGKEHREEIAFVGFSGGCGISVFGDETVDDGVEVGFGSAEFD